MKSRIVLFAALASLSILGWGCKKTSGSNTTTQNGTGFVQDAYLPTRTPEDIAQAETRQELLEALEAFRNLTTFRAKLSIRMSDGETRGDISVMKPDRFHGLLHTPGEESPGEFIGVSNTLYVRLPDKSWLPLNSATMTRALRGAFNSAIEGENSLVHVAIPEDAKIEKTPTPQCTQYTTTVAHDGYDAVTLNVCVKDGLPQRIEAQTDSGLIVIDYYDQNKLFVIERP